MSTFVNYNNNDNNNSNVNHLDDGNDDDMVDRILNEGSDDDNDYDSNSKDDNGRNIHSGVNIEELLIEEDESKLEEPIISTFTSTIPQFRHDESYQTKFVTLSKDPIHENNSLNDNHVVKTSSSSEIIISSSSSSSSPPQMNENENHNENEYESISNNTADILSTNDHLHHINKADQREQRSLNRGNKDIIHVLSPSSSLSGNTKSSLNIVIENMNSISLQLKRNADYKQHGPGLGCVVHANSKFIAVGTTRGYILIFDHSQEIRQVLGTTSTTGVGQSITSAISSIDSTYGGNYIITGNMNGQISLFDVLKGSCIKTLSDLHDTKIERIIFTRSLSDSSTFTISQKNMEGMIEDKINELTVVSVDSKGISFRLRFIKQMWSSFGIESDCLLDGKMGFIQELKSVKSLKEFTFQVRTFSDSSTHSFIHSSIPNSFKLIALSTSSKTYIIQIWPLVKILYKWPIRKNQFHSTNRVSIVLDWGWKVIVDSDDKRTTHPVLIRGYDTIVEKIIIQYEQVQAPSSISSHSNDQTDSFNPFKFIEDGDRDLEISNEVACLRYISESQIIVVTMKNVIMLSSNLDIIESSPLSTDSLQSFSQIIDQYGTMINRYSGVNESLYVLISDGMLKFSCQLWIEKLDEYVSRGKWLECLSFICSNYSSFKSSILTEAKTDLLRIYVAKYLQLTMNTSLPPLSSSSNSHYNLVASVCLELCTTVDRLDLLFGYIYDIFHSTGQMHVFINALEPFILSRKIRYLPPNIMSAVLNFSKSTNRLTFLERCIVYLDVERIDMNFVSKFLLDNKMYSSFLYAFGYGSIDLGGAFQIILDRLINESHSDLTTILSHGWSPTYDQINICYKLLLFIKYAVEDLIYPRHESFIIPIDWLISLLEAISAREYKPPTILRSTTKSTSDVCPNFICLYMLTSVDSYATIYYYCKLIARIQNHIKQDDQKEQKDQKELISKSYLNIYHFIKQVSSTFTLFGNIQSTFFSLAIHQLSTCSCCLDVEIIESFIQNVIYGSEIHYNREVLVSSMITNQLKYICNLSSTDQNQTILNILKQNGYFRTILKFIHYEGKSFYQKDMIEMGFEYYINVLTENRSKGIGEPTQQLFDYLDDVYNYYLSKDKTMIDSMIINRILQITNLDLHHTKLLCSTRLLGNFYQIYNNLQSYPQKQYDICRSMIYAVIDDPTKELSNYFTSDDILSYIKILIQWKPNQVFLFVQKYDHFPIDEVIDICKSRGILDAAAILIEKTGNISEALDLMLGNISNHIIDARNLIDETLKFDHGKGISDNLSQLKLLLHNILTNKDRISSDYLKSLSFFQQLENDINHISSLCRRYMNKSSNNDIWFKSFDYIITERKKFLKILSSTGEIICVIISHLIQVFVSDMKDSVSSSEIVTKVTQIYSGSKYIEFKDVILGMIRIHQHEIVSLQSSHNIQKREYGEILKIKFRYQRRGILHQSSDNNSSNNNDSNDVKSNSNSNNNINVYQSKVNFKTKNSKELKKNKFQENLESWKVRKEFLLYSLNLSPPAIIYDISDQEYRYPGTLPLQPSFVNSYDVENVDEMEN